MLNIQQITVQDRIDGGISFLMRCPGQRSSDLENLTVDVYISPRELLEAGTDMNRKAASFVQSFGKDFALPHLRRFAARCRTEGVVLPQTPRKYL